MATNTPNMTLIVPVIGADSGLTWEQSMNTNSATIDQHNHSPGQGIQIPPSGLNINTALTFNNQQATSLQAVQLQAQTSLATLGALYVVGANLFYNDYAGNAIQITAGGNVNATSSGITSGTASASFVSSVLVVNAAVNKPANIQAGSILLGNNITGSNYLTLQPPNAMGSSFSLTLPTVPSVTSIMQLDSSGNMSSVLTVDGTTLTIAANVLGVSASGIGTTQIANLAVTTGKIANNAVTRDKLAALGQQTSGNSSTFSSTSTTLVDITNLSVTLTTTGRPVMLILQSFPNGTSADVSISNSSSTNATATLCWSVGGVDTAFHLLGTTAAGNGANAIALTLPAALSQIVFPSAGSTTFKLRTRVIAGTTISVSNCQIVAYEL